MEDMKADEKIKQVAWGILNENISFFEHNGFAYKPTLRNVWLYCKGKLKEKHASGYRNDTHLQSTDDGIKYFNKDKVILSNIEENLHQIIKHFLFELNDAKTRAEISRDIHSMFVSYVITGIISDYKAEYIEGYFIISVQIDPNTEGYTIRLKI